MTGWIANRLGALESRVEYLIRLIADLTQQLRGAQQAAKGVGSDYNNAPTGSGGGAFKCVSAAGTAGGGSSSETIQQLSAGSFSSIGTATIYNPMPSDAIPSGHTVTLAAVGDGTYMALSVSCT
jgi:hypothetical protein